MTDAHQKTGSKDASAMNTVAAGVVGAIAGGAAVAAAVLMSNKDNQKKVQVAFADTKDKVTKVIHEAKKQLEK